VNHEVVTFDKDSTLSDASHRRWLAMKVVSGEDGYEWEHWAKACTEDKPIESARTLMYLLAPHYPLYVLSGSTDCQEGRSWLIDHRFPYSGVFFRQPEDEGIPNGVLKVRWIRQLQAQGMRVKMHVDDDLKCAEVIEAETGVPVLTVNPRYEFHAPESV
jgi:hypothetical protein